MNFPCAITRFVAFRSAVAKPPYGSWSRLTIIASVLHARSHGGFRLGTPPDKAEGILGRKPTQMVTKEQSGNTVEVAEESTPMTAHAKVRMRQRSVPPDAVEAALTFGREVHTRGATIYAIGRREVREAAAVGEDLGAFEGVQVVCARDGAVITVYRNADFSGLRPGVSHFRRLRAA